MMLRIVRLRDKGKPKSKYQLKSEQPQRLDVAIEMCMDNPMGRLSRVARIQHGGPYGEDPLPRLYDAEVNSMAALAMTITGVEEVDGAMYAQSWWCGIDK